MAVYFLDSSALANRYVAEPGSTWIAALIHPSGANQIHVARISGVEVVPALTKGIRAGSIRPEVGAAAITQFRGDFAKPVRIVEISAALVSRAMDLAERRSLRGYDAVQLAAALAVKDRGRRVGLGMTLVSADDELNAAAAAEGLQVENPNLH